MQFGYLAIRHVQIVGSPLMSFERCMLTIIGNGRKGERPYSKMPNPCANHVIMKGNRGEFVC